MRKKASALMIKTDSRNTQQLFKLFFMVKAKLQRNILRAVAKINTSPIANINKDVNIQWVYLLLKALAQTRNQLDIC